MSNPFLVPATCQCEQTRCEHGEHECRQPALHNVATIYGVFKMCDTCAKNLPKEYKKEEAYSSKPVDVERSL